MRTIMRRALACLLTATALMAAASLAHANPGIAMRWDQCYGDGGVSNKNFACDTNNGSETLVVSFKPPTDLDQVSGNEIQLYLQAPGSALPSWWQFKNLGSCRTTSLSLNSNASANAVACLDEFAGNATTGIGGYNTAFGSASTVRLDIAEAVPATVLATLSANQEYFALNIVIDHRKTVGAGACSGCVTPMCLVLSHVYLTRVNNLPNIQLTDLLGPNSQTVGWQGASPVVAFSPGCNDFLCLPYWYVQSCSLPTPVRNQTWGAIKSLYR
jgi:hypothetical protein